ncbi:hypothetical protein EVAR_10595_1 [Eumeta japonica]|uniref:Uncharacterized protein n=1 Tax=Eumeta variegata TaxID=151549 RepID=A0A4C1U1Z2_EUMVA|nr:hypothetical protein EVAR_10595_1 [Eumeta japonica]
MFCQGNERHRHRPAAGGHRPVPAGPRRRPAQHLRGHRQVQEDHDRGTVPTARTKSFPFIDDEDEALGAPFGLLNVVQYLGRVIKVILRLERETAPLKGTVNHLRVHPGAEGLKEGREKVKKKVKLSVVLKAKISGNNYKGRAPLLVREKKSSVEIGPLGAVSYILGLIDSITYRI